MCVRLQHDGTDNLQHTSAAAGDGPDASSNYPAVCGLLTPIDEGEPPAKVTSGAYGSSESDDTPHHHLSTTPTAASGPQPQPQQPQLQQPPSQPQPQHTMQLAPMPAALFGQPGGPFISLALTPGASISLVAGRPVLAKPPPAAAVAAGAGPSAAAAAVAGQPALGLPHTLVPGAALSGPQAAAAIAAARTAGSLLSGGPAAAAAAAAGVHHRAPHKQPGSQQEDGSSSGAWCTPVCRRGLSSRGPCFHCGTTISSQWRSGPAHKPVLCNACGLYFRKVQSLPDHTCQVAGALEVRLDTGGEGVAAGLRSSSRHPHTVGSW